MKSKRCIIEQLEGRQLLSAAPAVGAAAPLEFSGTAVNGKGAVIDRLLMTVQRTANGFSDNVIMTDDDGNVTNLALNMNAAGQFSDTGADLTLAGRMNAAHTAITGTWTLSGAQGRTKGTLKLDVIPPPNASLPKTNQRTTITDYAGTDTNERGDTSNVTLEVVDTNGVRTGEVEVHNYDDQLVPIPFKISSSGVISFTFSLTGQTAIVQGKLSANGQTITGSWTSLNTDGTAGFGSLIANAVPQQDAAKG